MPYNMNNMFGGQQPPQGQQGQFGQPPGGSPGGFQPPPPQQAGGQVPMGGGGQAQGGMQGAIPWSQGDAIPPGYRQPGPSDYASMGAGPGIPQGLQTGVNNMGGPSFQGNIDEMRMQLSQMMAGGGSPEQIAMLRTQLAQAEGDQRDRGQQDYMRWMYEQQGAGNVGGGGGRGVDPFLAQMMQAQMGYSPGLGRGIG